MELVPYFIHPEIEKVVKYQKLDLFNIEKYIYDDMKENSEYLLTLEPRDWKEQDHYAVLRLSKVRFDASQELIRQAYRRQLLDHHPDKGKQRLRKCDDESNDYFSCITRAFDLLKDDMSRKSYDSADPEFDNSIPSLRDAKERFFKSFGPVFQRNSRWSKIQPVPSLGDEKTDIDEVFSFYNFWDNFETWREFSYLDEEGKQNCDSRDDRRHVDKLNRAERKKKSQEECKRINKLVDMAKTNDPRILKYNADRKAAKEAEKQAKIDIKLKAKMESDRLIREEKERLIREEAERLKELKNQTANLKKEKEAIKNKQKAEKRKLRRVCETYNYFGEALFTFQNSTKSLEMRRAEMMYIIDTICVKLSLADMTVLNEELEYATEFEILALMRSAEEKVNGKVSDILQLAVRDDSEDLETLDKCGQQEWTMDLNKAVLSGLKSFPSTTKNRWAAIAESMNYQFAGLNVQEKQVIRRAKLIKSDDSITQKDTSTPNLMTIDDNLKNMRII